MHQRATWVEQILPLENGDRLSRAEFERRYHAMPGVKKAELVEGRVVMPSPTRADAHGNQHADLIGVLFSYRVFTPGVYVADNSTLLLDLDNEPQPDAVMYVHPSLGGTGRLTTDGYLEGSVELVAEVAGSSASIDLGPKLTVYRRNGVREYVVWRVYDEAVDWFVLRGTEYDRLAADAAGVTRSEAFPGLWLNAPALLAGDLAAVLGTLQQGLASADHAAFAARLAARRT